jgi:hypothetical protein
VRIDLDLALGLFIMGGPAWKSLSVVPVGNLQCWMCFDLPPFGRKEKGHVQPGARACVQVPLSASCAPASDTNSLSPLPFLPLLHPTSNPFNLQSQNTSTLVSFKMTTRVASHAGSWYSSRASTLSSELDQWLAQVPSSIDGKELPVPGARIIIAP